LLAGGRLAVLVLGLVGAGRGDHRSVPFGEGRG
jgi:hypothetical protein